MQLITVVLKPRKLHVRPNPSIDAYFRKRHVFKTKELKNQARKGGTHATVYFRKYPHPKIKGENVPRWQTRDVLAQTLIFIESGLYAGARERCID